MPNESLITQQTVSTEKNARAHDLRANMTHAERKLWSRLRAGRLEGFHFRRQQIIEPYIVDFYCHQAALVVEVDGGVHQDQEEQDRQREENQRAMGGAARAAVLECGCGGAYRRGAGRDFALVQGGSAVNTAGLRHIQV